MYADIKTETTAEGITRQKYSYPLTALQMRDKVILTVTDKNGTIKELKSAAGVSYPNGYEYSVEKYIGIAKQYYKTNTREIILSLQIVYVV